MSFFHKSPPEWLAADVIATRPAVEQRLINQMINRKVPPTVRELDAGTNFFQQGYAAQAVHLVLDGEVAVSVDGAEVARLGPGSVFGEMAVLTNRQRKGTVTAVVPTIVASVGESSVDRDDLRELAESHGFHAPAD
jgi:CRP-like cAMP-binding protein